MPAKLFDDPTDEMTKGPHAEPEGDESYIDSIMGQDISSPVEGEEDLFKESPLESALMDAGFKASPEQLTQIEAILKKPAVPGAKPAVPGAKPMAPGAKPMAPGAKPMAPMGGAVPGAMNTNDLPMR